MHHKNRLLVAVVMLLSGCALQDTRYDNSGSAAGFGPDYNPTILDWNFPTATNQGPLLPPERFRPVLPAIGVPWATGNPMPWQQGDLRSSEGARAEGAAHDAPSACVADCENAAISDAEALVADSRTRERAVIAERR